MQALVDINKITPPFDELVEQIVTDLNRKLVKAKQSTIRAQDVTWSYVWAIGIGRVGHALDNCFVALSGKFGRRESSAGLFTPGQDGTPTPRHLLPPEVLHAHRPRPKVDPDYPHVSVFETTGAKKTIHYATGGYTNGKDTIILNVSEGADIDDDGCAFETLLKISDTTATCPGRWCAPPKSALKPLQRAALSLTAIKNCAD